MAENLGNGIPNEDRSPKSGHRMAAQGMRFSWRRNDGTISPTLGVIRGMSAEARSREQRAGFLDLDQDCQRAARAKIEKLRAISIWVLPMIDAHNMVDYASDAAFAIDDGLNITAWNRGAQQLLGYAPGEVIGQQCCDVLQAVLPGGEPPYPGDCPS